MSTTPAPNSGSQPSVGGIEIENIDLQGELVTLKNTSPGNMDLSGWKLLSVTGNQSYTFPAGTIIKAGSTLTIASGEASGDIKWTARNIWNNDGDPAELINAAGTVVSRD